MFNLPHRAIDDLLVVHLVVRSLIEPLDDVRQLVLQRESEMAFLPQETQAVPQENIDDHKEQDNPWVPQHHFLFEIGGFAKEDNKELHQLSLYKSVQNKSGQRNHRETVVESSVLSGFQQLLGIARTVREPSVDKVHQVDESLDEEKVA